MTGQNFRNSFYFNNISSEKNNATISSEANEIIKELENDNMSCQIKNY